MLNGCVLCCCRVLNVTILRPRTCGSKKVVVDDNSLKLDNTLTPSLAIMAYQ